MKRLHKTGKGLENSNDQHHFYIWLDLSFNKQENKEIFSLDYFLDKVSDISYNI